MGVWLAGKPLADRIKADVAKKAAEYKDRTGRTPGLAAVLVGDNKASQVYVRTKEKTSQQLGFASRILKLPADIDARALEERIRELNRDEDIDGILVQLPLPGHLDPWAAVAAIDPRKDVDGIHPVTLGRLVQNQDAFKTCTPQGVLELLKDFGVALEGKNVAVIGRSLIVGKPLAVMLTNENATVTVCHSKTRDLPGVVSRADIVVAAMGRPAFVTPDFVKEGAVVVDVGINSVTDARLAGELFGDDPARRKDLADKGYTLVGDVHPAVVAKAAALTPVPGGVGPLTVAALMKNTLEAFRRLKGLD
ncbi:MAG: bifunctional methylenetetrahydrofolate dehydrogenase/methenyltetrahydrofolate cyclohydrolase FolD [Candidatus Aminicenantes bacterium]|nr:bifunctional methylenetetrahydrofolate dehydrogenase/methenyltetrahydrofolate cyclohydrolase FolD [Candidatus Aminicenantes bacterium]